MSEPEYLYKYQKMPSDIHRLMDLFVYNKLWFSSPSSFNDPFDCKIHIDFSDSDIEDLRQLYRRLINTYDEALTKEELKILDNLFFIYGFHRIFPNKIKDAIQKYKENATDTQISINDIYILGKENIIKFLQRISHEFFGIICCNESKDNILMWSHYADSHKGFCLEFDKALIHNCSDQKTWGKCLKIEYEQSFYKPQELLNIANNTDEFVEKTIFKKTPVWKYEQEWRIIAVKKDDTDWITHKDRNIKFPPEMLTGIIFGCEMKPEDRDAIWYLIQSNPELKHVRRYEAMKKPNEFGLDIEEIT